MEAATALAAGGLIDILQVVQPGLLVGVAVRVLLPGHAAIGWLVTILLLLLVRLVRNRRNIRHNVE